MDPAWKEKWTAALRSGTYEQGQNFLRDVKGRYCCLGVLCDIVDPAGWRADDKGKPYFTQDGSSDAYSNPPLSIREKVDLGYLDIKQFIVMNDIEGLSFARIADHIEENL